MTRTTQPRRPGGLAGRAERSQWVRAWARRAADAVLVAAADRLRLALIRAQSTLRLERQQWARERHALEWDLGVAQRRTEIAEEAAQRTRARLADEQHRARRNYDAALGFQAESHRRHAQLLDARHACGQLRQQIAVLQAQRRHPSGRALPAAPTVEVRR